MQRNQIKANWLLDEIGWTLRQPGKFEEWDGAVRWFVEQTEARPELMREAYVRRWRAAAGAAAVSAGPPHA